MKQLSIAVLLFSTIVLLSRPASATVVVSLDPQPSAISGLANVFVDINVSGLDTLLGAYDLDITYDPSVFVPLLVPPAGFGSRLGDIFLGEAVGGIDTATPGVINLFQISLLLSSELDDLQGDPPGSGNYVDSFTLATIGLYRFDNSTGAPASILETDNIILSDDLGFQISVDSNPPAIVKVVPVPGSLLLLAIGLLGLSIMPGRFTVSHKS